MTNLDQSVDVVVVGAGNAGLCAALAAAQAGANVVILDRAKTQYRGGNTAFTAGAMRVAYNDTEDIRELVPDLSRADADRTDFGKYTVDSFFDDLAQVSGYRTDPALAHKVASESFDTLRWMKENGVRFLPMYGRQAYEFEGRFTFWGGLTLEVAGGGPGLVESLTSACEAAGVKMISGARATELVTSPSGIDGVVIVRDGQRSQIGAKAVVLAAGGFESNPEWRTRYLGPGWDLAKVRGTRYNNGDGIRMALDAGASARGNWSGCHAVAWEANAPEFGDPRIGDSFQKHSYPLGVLVNTEGRRFLDEGAHFRNYTYAKYGVEILRQPGHIAFQIFDNKVEPLLRDEYRIREVTRYTAETLEELAARIPQLDSEQFLDTINRYNDAVDTETPWDPNVLDRRHTTGLTPNKTNWAQRIDEPPFSAYEVTCGITFTYGGVRVDEQARVLNDDGEPIRGLFAAGEMVGGLFYFNYPGGSGLTAGAIFGRTAGRNAAKEEHH